LLLASVGTYSGPVASALIQILYGAQMWVKTVNQNGGLAGHTVKLFVYDDGADPARHRAQVQDAVEQRKVVAFLANAEPLTGQASVEYLTKAKVPVIGMSGAEPWAYTSPMFFPQASNDVALYRTIVQSVGTQAVARGKTKVGTLVCVEIPGCAQTEQLFSDSAAKLGYQHVYKGRTSLAQPDFTAECLAARNAGAEVLFILLDPNSISRVSGGCVRQGFKPTFAASAQGIFHDMKKDPNLDGLLTSSPVFPFFQGDTPATREFQDARAEFGQKYELAPNLTLGWVAGKLAEKAGAKLSEPPTSASLLAGLWAIRNDNLNGLTQPLTFLENQPPKPVVCWFNITIKSQEWRSPDNSQLHCEPNS
jgi:branched-chain amino acid transport system substrate-binding protein